MKHCSRIELAMYGGRALGFLARWRVRLHLLGCARCRSILQQLTDDETLIHALRQARNDFMLSDCGAPEEIAARSGGRDGDSAAP